MTVRSRSASGPFPGSCDDWRRCAGAVLVALTLCLPGAARAAEALDAWRVEITRTRTLAENDAPLAYEHAQRLESTIPADAGAADKARVLNLLARIEVYLALTEKSASHAQRAFDLATQGGDKLGRAEADLNVALNSVNEGKIDALVTATTRSLAELDGVDRPDLMGEALLRTAMMYRRVGQIEDSVTMAMQAMEIARRVKDPLALTYAHQGLAISFDQSFRQQEAHDHFVQMREQARAAHSKQLEAYALIGLGNILTTSLGDAAGGERRVREAVELFREAGAPFAIAFGLSQLATNLRAQHRDAEALPLLDQVVATYERYPNRIGLWYSLNARSAVYQSRGNSGAARSDATRAYSVAKDIDFPLYISESAQRMAALAAAAGDTRRAYALTLEANDMTAKATRERAGARMVELAQRYESESKQREINELTQRNRLQATELQQGELHRRLLWTGLGAGVLVFAGTMYFLLRLRRSQHDLQQQTAILQSVLDSMADGVVVADGRGQVILVNPMAEKILGVDRAQLRSRDWPGLGGLYLPDQTTPYPTTDLPLVRAIRGESCDNVELFMSTARRPDGRWLSAAARPLTDPSGATQGGVAVFSDVTERKHAEAALRVREQEFRALVENAPDLVARYDSACRRTYANPATAQRVGAPLDALLGTTPTELSDMPPDQAQRYERQLREVLASGDDASIDVSLLDARSIQFRLVAERDLHGGVVSVLAIGRDVTALMNTQRQLTTLLHNLPDMVARYDREGRYLYVNPAVTRTFGMSADDFVGRTAGELGLDHHGVMGGALRRVIDHAVPNMLELPWEGPYGERFFETRLVPELDERGSVDSVLGIAREVTERKRVEQLGRDQSFRREAAREEERKYIARELHDELGQLLSALRLEVSVVRLRFGQSNPAIGERTASMLALVDSIIRLQRDLVSSLRPAVLDLGIGPALEWLVGEFTERSGVVCRLQLSEALIALDADQTTMVFRIVQESLTNVARHARASRVDVALQRRPDGYLLTVQDDGRGFDLLAARNPKSLGLIGLHERAQMLGGRLDLRSGANAGVTIAVAFPAAIVGRKRA